MNTIIEFINYYSLSLLVQDSWNFFELLSGIIIIVVCIIQRVWMQTYSSSNTMLPYYIIKLCQVGLFGQMAMGLMAISDGSSNINNIVAMHIIILFWCVFSSMAKMGVIYSYYFGLKSQEMV